jgi:hypothetical protein
LTTSLYLEVRADEPKQLQKKEYTLFACGDFCLARWVAATVYSKGPRWPIEEVAPWIRSADVSLVNLECVIATRGYFFDKGEEVPHQYRGRPEMLDVLTEAGVDVATLANNHAMDYGPNALLECKEILNAVGIAPVGAGKNYREASTPTYVKVDDLVIAFIGIDTETPMTAATEKRGGIFCIQGEEAVKKALEPVIAEAKKKADLVVFTPHWGANFTDNPTPARVDLARWVIDQGVDAILGHSAHQLHGIEIYKGRPIVYDMGSFFFDRVTKDRFPLGSGFILKFDREGFKGMTIRPAILEIARTRRAKRKEIKKIQDIIVNLSRELDPNIKFGHDGDALTLSFSPETPATKRTEDPELLHRTGTTRPLPEEIRSRKTSIVLDAPPKWTKGMVPVELENGIRVLGARVPSQVRPNYAFAAEIALQVPDEITIGSWLGFLKAVSRKDKRTFLWAHPIADGGWDPSLWREGQIVVDRTLARPRGVWIYPRHAKLTEGMYDLYWGFGPLEHRDAEQDLVPVKNPRPRDKVDYVHIGTIYMTKRAPDGPAGITWGRFTEE